MTLRNRLLVKNKRSCLNTGNFKFQILKINKHSGSRELHLQKNSIVASNS